MKARDFIFEIGTEEIPSAALCQATKALPGLASKLLEDARLEHGAVRAYSTPRRLIIAIEALAEFSTEYSYKKRGPKVSLAFDASGAPTPAALGFARGAHLEPDCLIREFDSKGVEYVYAPQTIPAQSAQTLLQDSLCHLIEDIPWPKLMRWGSNSCAFSRPIRWLLALFGPDLVPLNYAGVSSGRLSYGHRLIAPEAFEVSDASSFFTLLEGAYVIYDAAERARIIREQIAAIEAQFGLRAQTPKTFFDEVVNLVEYPTALLGHFDERFLEVPPEIITDAMLVHQRYFPMYKTEASLDNSFIVVSNGNPEYSSEICAGNERVLRARLADAEFFVKTDLRVPLESYLPKLDKLVFQEKLGSMGEKTKRIVSLARHLCSRAQFDEQTCRDALRAALLCKADLVTSAVIEFTSLQGVMGGYYARACGEPLEVADAISDHYKPRFAGDTLPRTLCGKIVAVADKLDTICGLFALGQPPTASSDPYALRRACIGVINIVLSGLDLKLRDLIDAALGEYEKIISFNREEVSSAIYAFFTTRLAVIARNQNYEPDVVEAVLACGIFEPKEALRRIEALHKARLSSPKLFEDLATAYRRAEHIRDASLGTCVDTALFGEYEAALYKAIQSASAKFDEALSLCASDAALAALAALRGPIDEFFDKVMVMDKDQALRKNRLRLLNAFVALFSQFADISKLVR